MLERKFSKKFLSKRSSERPNKRSIFSNSILFKNIVPHTNKNKYYKFLKILYYFQYKPTNILMPVLIKIVIKETFRSFERSELQTHEKVRIIGN